VHPLSKTFRKNLEDFATICRIVNGMKQFSIGAIGARTTKFKTVRYDVITLQKYDIAVEIYDISELIYKVQQKFDDRAVVEKKEKLVNYTDFSKVPTNKLTTLAKSAL
jgi:L-fucose isomerase-like protein